MPAPLLPARQVGALEMLTEDKGKDWLAKQGVAVPQGRVATAEQLSEIAHEIGFPVALKMMSPLLAHKTEAGAVALNLNDDAEVSKAAAQMRTRRARPRFHAGSCD